MRLLLSVLSSRETGERLEVYCLDLLLDGLSSSDGCVMRNTTSAEKSPWRRAQRKSMRRAAPAGNDSWVRIVGQRLTGTPTPAAPFKLHSLALTPACLRVLVCN